MKCKHERALWYRRVDGAWCLVGTLSGAPLGWVACYFDRLTIENETAEHIAAWWHATRTMAVSVSGFDRDELDQQCADIRAGAWRKGGK